MKTLKSFILEASKKYVWFINRCNKDFEVEESIYSSLDSADKRSFNSEDEAYKDAVKFFNFWKNEFKKGFFNIEVYEGQDLIMSAEIQDGKLKEF